MAFISGYHRGLVDDQEITIKWVARTASESAGLRIDLKQTVNSACLYAGRFAHPLGSMPHWRAKKKPQPFGGQDTQD